LLAGCSSASFNNLFQNYNEQMRGVKHAQQQGDFQKAINLLPHRKSNDGSYALSLLEKARLEYLAGNNEYSQQDFFQVYQLLQKAQQAAKIELSRGVENLSAMLSNDNAVRYDIPLYEQSMLHSYQALNYLQQKDLSGALVEIRRANLVQHQALKENIDSTYRAKNKLENDHLSISGLANNYPDMSTVIGKIKNGFQNAYTFYLSGVIYEAAGQLNDAYIDYKKALEIYPNNSYLQLDVWRLANILHMTDDIRLYEEQFSQEITLYNNKVNQGQIFVIAENGIVAAKQEKAINLPVYTRHNEMRFYSVALPSYENHLNVYSPIALEYQGKSYHAQEIVRVQSLAAKQLKDQLPMIIARQISRLVAKEELRQQMQRKGGDLGNIFASLYNMATEKADTRSWSTLPDSIQIMRLNLASGTHQLKFSVNGINETIDAAIEANKTTLIKLTVIGNYINYQIVNL
jgi:hypothetical protein